MGANLSITATQVLNYNGQVLRLNVAAGQTITRGQAIYAGLSTSPGQWYLAKADTIQNLGYYNLQLAVIGIALNDAGPGQLLDAYTGSLGSVTNGIILGAGAAIETGSIICVSPTVAGALTSYDPAVGTLVSTNALCVIGICTNVISGLCVGGILNTG